MNLISRKEAKARGLRWYFTGEPCHKGHLCERRVSQRACILCEEERRANPDYKRKAIERSRKRYSTPEGKEKEAENWRRRQDTPEGRVKTAERKRKRSTPEAKRETSERGKRYYHSLEGKAKRAERCASPEYIIKRRAWMREYMRRRYATSEGKKEMDESGKRYLANPENRRKARERHAKWIKTPFGHFSSRCKEFAHLVDYTPEEHENHLKSTLPYNMTVWQARSIGYHRDHILPKKFIFGALGGDDPDLARKVVEDLKNLRMIPGNENISKGAKLALDLEQEELLIYLGKKYGVLHLLVDHALGYHFS